MKKNIAFLIPIYPVHYKYSYNLIKSWQQNNLNEQSDIWFVLTNEEEKELFLDWDNIIILPPELRNFGKHGIINIKKLYGINTLKDKYEYIIALDSEAEFIKNVDIYKLCNNFFETKLLYGNIATADSKITEKVKNACKEYFSKFDTTSLCTPLYLWFNQPCIYKASTINDFLDKINYNQNSALFRWEDFDYYLYMYYLLLFNDFSIYDLGVSAKYSFCEAEPAELKIYNNAYKNAKIYMASKSLLYKFDNPDLFITIHLDRELENIKIKLNNLEHQLKYIKKYSIILIIRKLLSLFIPNKKLRKKIRGKY